MPVVVEGGDVRFDGQSTGLDPQGLPDGAARLFVRPYEMAIVPRPEIISSRAS